MQCAGGISEAYSPRGAATLELVQVLYTGIVATALHKKLTSCGAVALVLV